MENLWSSSFSFGATSGLWKAPTGRGAGEVESTAQKSVGEPQKQGSVSFRVETVVANWRCPVNCLGAGRPDALYRTHRPRSRTKTANFARNLSSQFLMWSKRAKAD